jgi:similar to stage IV sporulation protein
MTAHKGIYMWNVTHVPGGVTMNLSIKGFKRLKECVHKTKCHVRILNKKGLPFILHRYRKRKILISGLLLSVLAVYFLSCFIWLIDVKGVNRIAREELIAFCGQQGLQIGSFKYKIDNKKVKTDIMNHFRDISWIDISIKGTRANIQIVETIPKPAILDKSTPCNIVASKDGLITSIVTGAGAPLVKQNDVVRKGDILVSGQVKATGDSGDIQKTVHAYAEVWAKMYNEINFDIPYQYEVKRYTENEKKQYSLLVFGRTFNLPHFDMDFESYDRSTRRYQINFGEDYPLPVIVLTDIYREFEPVTLSRTADQARELAEKMVNARIIREFDFQADIVDKSVALQETPDGLKVQALITTNERIDQEEPLQSPAQQTADQLPAN